MAPPNNSTKIGSQLLKAQDAADLLNVDIRTIHAWIEKGDIPYIKLPGKRRRPSYRIPLQGLLNSLSGTYDLAGDIEALYDEADR
jgi:excisionase family DNA binding protein